VGLPVDQGDARVCPAVEVGLPVDQGDARVCPAAEVGLPVDQGDACIGAKHERTEGTELEFELSESKGAEGTAPPLKRRWLLRRKKAIGRHKDGRKVKHGTYNYVGMRESLGLAHSAPPQHVLSAVMIDQDHQHFAIVPLKSDLQRDLKKALACNLKHLETIKHLKNENHLQKATISLPKSETKALVEDIDPIIVSSCILMEDEHSETQADGIINRVNTNDCNDCAYFFYNNHAQCKKPLCLVQINSLKNRLTRDVMRTHCPEKLHLVPSPAGIDTSKLGGGGVIMTDTCNTAQKSGASLLIGSPVPMSLIA
jgi:hypothetical protein